MKLGRIPIVSDFADPGGDANIPVSNAKIDSQSNRFINELERDATRSPDQIANESLVGVEGQPNHVFQSDDQLMQAQQRMGGPALGDALANRYRQYAGEDIGRIASEARHKAQLTKADRLSKSAEMNLARQGVKTSAYARLVQARSNRMAARAEVIRSFLGLGGAAAGAAFGGPAGAVIGSQAAGAVSGPSQQTQPMGQQQPSYLGGNQMAGSLGNPELMRGGYR